MNGESPDGTGRRIELYKQAVAADIAVLRHALSESGLLKTIRSRPETSIRNIMLASAAIGFLLDALRQRLHKKQNREQLERLLEMLSHVKEKNSLPSRFARIIQSLSEAVHAAYKEAESTEKQ